MTDTPKWISAYRVLDHVSLETGVQISSIISRARGGDWTVTARHIAAILMLEHSQLSLQEVARVLGRQNHTTILSIKKKYAKDKRFRANVERVRARMLAGMAT
jgi:chromosomal replication initiation ATPase DnaA